MRDKLRTELLSAPEADVRLGTVDVLMVLWDSVGIRNPCHRAVISFAYLYSPEHFFLFLIEDMSWGLAIISWNSNSRTAQ